MKIWNRGTNSLYQSWIFLKKTVKKQSSDKTALTKIKIKAEENQQKQVIKENLITEKIENLEEKTFEFIKKFEGFNPTAYWDFKHCSIWYWTTTRDCKETITEEEAKKRAIQKIKDIRKHHNLYKYDDNLEIALISFVYNVWKPPKNFRWYIKNNYKKALKNLMIKYIYAWWKKLKWLENRRRAEINLF